MPDLLVSFINALLFIAVSEKYALKKLRFICCFCCVHVWRYSHSFISICRHKGTRSISILEVTNVFSRTNAQSEGNPKQSTCLVLDLTPWIPDSRYWIPVSISGTLESGIQSLVGFRISWAVFRIPKPRSLHSTIEFLLNSSFHKQNFLGLPYMGRELILTCENIRFSSLFAAGDVSSARNVPSWTG